MTASGKVSQTSVKIMMPVPITFSSKPENIHLCEKDRQISAEVLETHFGLV